MKGIYPGTFDPITNGHLDIIERSAKMFHTLIVAIAIDTEKNTFFSNEKRLEMVNEAIHFKGIKNAKAELFSGLLISFVKESNSQIIIRGLRAVSDFEYEFQMACINSKLDKQIETIFLPSKDDMHFVSSRFIKSVAKLGGDISHFVPPCVKRDYFE